ncbi:MAG: Hint domain-containing protein [Roseicyclus sp.]|jgi:hypothetical protein|uniref:Hint domain-containing protein n=1 Tax=Roseicyclus sp. TaxID=1914329 RepID=UPI003A8B45CE
MSAPFRHEFLTTPRALSRDPSTGPEAVGLEATGFVAGTRIATPMGYVAVERLRAGDSVLTADGRHATILWSGASQMPGQGAFAPVLIETGVMDNIRPLRVGQGHLVRFEGWQAELLFDTGAVLASARSFVDGAGIRIDDSAETVTYIHLMLERHEIILAENVACETLRPGAETALLLAGLAACAEAFEHPALPMVDAPLPSEAALPVLSEREERLLRAA